MADCSESAATVGDLLSCRSRHGCRLPSPNDDGSTLSAAVGTTNAFLVERTQPLPIAMLAPLVIPDVTCDRIREGASPVLKA